MELSSSSLGNLLQAVSGFLVVSVAPFLDIECSYCMAECGWCVAVVDYVDVDVVVCPLLP